MATFEIVESEGQKMVKATLAGDTLRAESGALHYYQGNISVQSKAPSAGGSPESVRGVASTSVSGSP